MELYEPEPGLQEIKTDEIHLQSTVIYMFSYYVDPSRSSTDELNGGSFVFFLEGGKE